MMNSIGVNIMDEFAKACIDIYEPEDRRLGCLDPNPYQFTCELNGLGHESLRTVNGSILDKPSDDKPIGSLAHSLGQP